MSGTTKKKARESAERCIPAGALERELRIDAFVAGYMAGHAAHTRWANKKVFEYRLAQQRGVSGADQG